MSDAVRQKTFQVGLYDREGGRESLGPHQDAIIRPILTRIAVKLARNLSDRKIGILATVHRCISRLQ